MQKATQGRGGVAFTVALIAGIAGALAMAALDRTLKVFTISPPAVGGVIVDGWLYFRSVANANLAFGLPFPSAILPALSGGVIFVFGWWWVAAVYQRAAISVCALTFIIAGACSNLIDRVRWGHVVDYIDVPWFTVFNLADVMITFGVGLLILRELIRWWQGRVKIQGNNF